MTKDMISRLCSYLERTPENETAVREIRRLLVLGCVLLEKHVHGITSFEDELKSGLLTAEEYEELCNQKLSLSARNGKRERFPTNNRPAFAYFKCYQHTMVLARRQTCCPVALWNKPRVSARPCRRRLYLQRMHTAAAGKRCRRQTITRGSTPRSLR